MENNDNVEMVLDGPTKEKKFTLISKEKENMEVTATAAMSSRLLKTMIEGDEEETGFNVEVVSSSVLRKVIQYLEYHTTIPSKEVKKPLEHKNMVDLVGEFDADFINVDKTIIFDLVEAANYMDIKPLMDLCFTKVASLIKGESVEKIRETLGIVNDWTVEESEQIKKDNLWVEES